VTAAAGSTGSWPKEKWKSSPRYRVPHARRAAGDQLAGHVRLEAGEMKASARAISAAQGPSSPERSDASPPACVFAMGNWLISPPCRFFVK